MKIQKKPLIIAIASVMSLSASHALQAATTQLQFTDQISLSDQQVPDLNDAFKTKLVSLGNGVLVSVFGDAVDANKLVYDVKDQVDRPARDIFIRTCPSLTADCSIESNWSDVQNVSGTALLSSMSTDWDGDTDSNNDRKAYYGDSDKPNISNGGNNIMLTWTDKYCGAEATNQRSVTYLTRDNREVPFSCTWARKASVDAAGVINWEDKKQLSDGTRDAKQDVSKVNLVGNAVITWQEDPLGLQLGAADGPGDGASGATASHGTDIWIATKTEADGYTDSIRLTDNAVGDVTASGNHDLIRSNATGTVVEDSNIEGGQAAATRANTGLVGPTIVVAYEETKGSEGLAIGKFVRYHNLPFISVAGADLNQAGCIISNPLENARRVRFVAQTDDMMAQVNAVQGDIDSTLRMGIFWKEGEFDQGGPSDIMVRLAKGGLAATNLVPAVDATNCVTSDYLLAEDLANTPAMNISSNSAAGTNNLTDGTDTNIIENALAHRGAIVGNDLYIGYSYTTDWALATYTNLVNYDFWLRHYDATTGTWTAPKNLSNLPTKEINVREPRFVKTPYAASGYNPNAFVIAWGTQTNVASHIEDPEELDIFYTRSFDKGVTMEPLVRIDNPNANARYESQLRLTPDGKTVYSAWNEVSESGTEAAFAVGTDGPITGIDPYDGLYGSDTPIVTTSSGGSAGIFDSVILPLLVGLSIGLLGFLGLRQARK